MKQSFILISIGLLLYSLSLFNGFVWDDEVYLQQNPALSFETKSALTNDVYFRPVMTFVYSTLYSSFGPTPFFFHLFPLLFHIGTAVLLFHLFTRFFRDKIAFLLALLFLVHPANVEAVCFASAFQEILFTFSVVFGLYLLVRSKEIEPITVICSTSLFTAALLMKETALVFFVLSFCYLILFHRKNGTAVQIYSAFSLLALFSYALLRFGSGNSYVSGPGLFPIMRVPFEVRLTTIPAIILFYIRTFFFPFHLEIAQHWVIQVPGFASFVLPIIIDSALVLGCIYYSIKKKNTVFFFFLCWFLLGLLPHLQIIPLNMTVAERWLYLPMIGLLGMGGAVAQNSKLKIKNLKLKIAGILIVLFLLFVRSFTRTLDWHTGLSLYSSTIAETSSFDLHNNMGVELYRVGKFAQAKTHFEKSTQLAPYWWVNWNNLGAAYQHEGNIQKAQECYEKSIKNGTYMLAYENLAKILIVRGTDKKEASAFLNKALKLFPHSEILRALYNRN